MKLLLIVLFTVLMQQLPAQSNNASDSLKQGIRDSIAGATGIPSVRYSFAYPAFNASKHSNYPEGNSHKVKLYWDPVYLKVVPFPVTTPNYKETWFTSAARLALEALGPYKKVQQ